MRLKLHGNRGTGTNPVQKIWVRSFRWSIHRKMNKFPTWPEAIIEFYTLNIAKIWNNQSDTWFYTFPGLTHADLKGTLLHVEVVRRCTHNSTWNRKHKNSLKKEGTKCNTPESVLDGLDHRVWIGLVHPLILEGDLFARRQTRERERERSVPFGCKILGWLWFLVEYNWGHEDISGVNYILDHIVSYSCCKMPWYCFHVRANFNKPCNLFRYFLFFF